MYNIIFVYWSYTSHYLNYYSTAVHNKYNKACYQILQLKDCKENTIFFHFFETHSIIFPVLETQSVCIISSNKFSWTRNNTN
jgi:hypothetical protein